MIKTKATLKLGQEGSKELVSKVGEDCLVKSKDVFGDIIHINKLSRDWKSESKS